MKTLILGGTGWLGSMLVQSALDAGHSVTALARGVSGSVPEGAAVVVVDRDAPDAYATVAQRRWDAVIDLTRQPGHARSAAAALQDCAAHYVLVSSSSVYAAHDTPGADESAALLPALEGDVMHSMETYGSAKVACEQHVRQALGAKRSLIARVGLIGGPGDTSDRSGYWPWRFAKPAVPDGAVLVPEATGCMTQMVDVRDLAQWLIQAAQAGTSGIFNVMGADCPLQEFLHTARHVAGHNGPLCTVSAAWLSEHQVKAWAGPRSMPLWLPMPDYAGFAARNGQAAVQRGLLHRPLAQTLSDTLAWELARPEGLVRRAGLPDAVERELLMVLD